MKEKKLIIMKWRAQKAIISGMPAFSIKIANIAKWTYLVDKVGFLHRFGLTLFHYMERIFILPLFCACIAICSIFPGYLYCFSFGKLRKCAIYNTMRRCFSTEQECCCQAKLLTTSAYHNQLCNGLGESKLDCF